MMRAQEGARAPLGPAAPPAQVPLLLCFNCQLRLPLLAKAAAAQHAVRRGAKAGPRRRAARAADAAMAAIAPQRRLCRRHDVVPHEDAVAVDDEKVLPAGRRARRQGVLRRGRARRRGVVADVHVGQCWQRRLLPPREEAGRHRVRACAQAKGMRLQEVLNWAPGLGLGSSAGP